MKATLLILGICISSTAFCQVKNTTKPLIYLNPGISFGKGILIEHELMVHTYKNIYTGVYYDFGWVQAGNIPREYRKKVPENNNEKLGINLGYILPVAGSKMKILLQAKPYYGKYKYITDFQVTHHPAYSADINSGNIIIDLFGTMLFSHGAYDTYDYNIRQIKYLGCGINTKLLLISSKTWGMTIGATYDYSPVMKELSGEIGMTFGAMEHIAKKSRKDRK